MSLDWSGDDRRYFERMGIALEDEAEPVEEPLPKPEKKQSALVWVGVFVVSTLAWTLFIWAVRDGWRYVGR
jgi:hypothetical protein